MNTPTLIPAKYQAALLSFGLTILAAVQAAWVGGFTEVEVYQLIGLGVGTAVTLGAPLSTGKFPAIFKILGAVVAAVIAAIVPIIDTTLGGPGWTPETILIVVFAGFQALAAQFGVYQRLDAVKEALAAPDVSDRVPVTVDGDAVKVVLAAGDAGDPVDKHDGHDGV